jgi:hypothetical protein
MWRVLALLAGALLLAGCSSRKPPLPSTYPVTGKVLDTRGAPLKGGTVQFDSGQPTDLSVVGLIEPDGTFTVKTFRNKDEMNGAPEGEYRLTINFPLSSDHVASPPVTLPNPYRVQPKDNNFELRLTQ